MTLASFGGGRQPADASHERLVAASSVGTLVLDTNCLGCGDPTWRACWSCCCGLCQDCFHGRHTCPTGSEVHKMFFAPEHVDEDQVCSRGLISYAAQALVILVAAVGVEGHAQ